MKDLPYTAGLFDGEGTVTITKHCKTDSFRRPIISLASTSPELMDFLKSNYGGCVVPKKSYKPHHKPSFTWSLQNDKALNFLSNIRPFMKELEKIRRVDLLLLEYKSLTPRNGKYSDESKQQRLLFEERFFHPSNS